MTNTELKIRAFEVLKKHLGQVEMEKFISIIQQEQFDYTRWRDGLFSNLDSKKISQLAMANRKQDKN